jgi:hypothetical protein
VTKYPARSKVEKSIDARRDAANPFPDCPGKRFQQVLLPHVRNAKKDCEGNFMFRRACIRKVVVGAAIVAAFMVWPNSPASFAQVTSGTILGTVTDPTGAAVAGAKITVTDTATGLQSNLTTNNGGHYELPYLPNGTYQIAVDAPGFKSFLQTGIILNIDQQYRVDVKLDVGRSSQNIVVEANALVLRTDSSQLGETIDQRTIESIPNINNNPLVNATLVPGVVSTGSFLDPNNVNTGDNTRTNFSSFTVNGSGPLTSNIQLDGAMDTSPYGNEIMVLPNMEAIAEAKVDTNAISAEYGRTAGGVVDFTTKSGTNSLHGTVYEHFRNSDLNANSFGDNTERQPRPPFNTNIFGGAFGGPVWIPKLYNGHNKTFFFASYEGLRRSQGESTYYTVPTSIERTGDFSQTRSLVTVNGITEASPVQVYLPFPSTTTTTQIAAGQYQINRQQASYNGVLNAISPQYLNSTALNFVKYYPLPNIAPLNTDGTDNYFTNAPTYTSTDQIILRLDQSFSSTSRAFFRWSTDWTLSNPPNIFAGTEPAANNNGPTTQFNPSATFGYDWIISPKQTLELRANFTRLNLVLKPCCGGANTNLGGLGFSPSELVGLPTSSFPDITDGSYPTMGLGGFVYRNNHTSVFSFTPNYAKLLNAWTLKFGMEYDGILYNFTQPYIGSLAFSSEGSNFSQACEGTGCPTIPASVVQGWGSANFVMGAIGGALGNGQYSTGDPSEALKNGYWAFYSQNDWKASRDLTINLGVRWEFQGPLTDRYNRLSQFNLNGTNETGTGGLYEFSGAGGDPRGQTNKDWKDWAPHRLLVQARSEDSHQLRIRYQLHYDNRRRLGSTRFWIGRFLSACICSDYTPKRSRHSAKRMDECIQFRRCDRRPQSI